MPWIRRRSRRYDDPYYYPPRPRTYRSPGNSCLRDACLLETGCCLGEALDDNCLMLTVLLLPRLIATAVSETRVRPAGSDFRVRTGRDSDVRPSGSEARVRPTDSAARLRFAEPAPGRAARVLVGAIRGYQREISPRLAVECRFTPSCSEYAAQAITRRGAVRGTLLAAGRLLRCRPGGARGADPVPA